MRQMIESMTSASMLLRPSVKRRLSLLLAVCAVASTGCDGEREQHTEPRPLDSTLAVVLATEAANLVHPSLTWEIRCYSALARNAALVSLVLGPSPLVAKRGWDIEATDGSGFALVAVTGDGQAFRLRLEPDSQFLRGEAPSGQVSQGGDRVDSVTAAGIATKAARTEFRSDLAPIVHCVEDVRTGWLVTLVAPGVEELPAGVRGVIVGVTMEGEAIVIERF